MAIMMFVITLRRKFDEGGFAEDKEIQKAAEELCDIPRE